MLKKHQRSKNILLPGITLIYGVAIYGRRINSDQKKVLSLKNFHESPREKFSKRRTYFLDPFYQHYYSTLFYYTLLYSTLGKYFTHNKMVGISKKKKRQNRF